MFQQLAQMLGEGDALVITVVALKDGRLALAVVPKGEFKNKDLGTGLSLEATPAEFDADLAEHLSAYVNQRKSLREQIETQTLVMAEAEKASKAATATAISKVATGKAAPTPKKTTPAKAAGDEGGADGDDERLDAGSDDTRPATAGGTQPTPVSGEISLF